MEYTFKPDEIKVTGWNSKKTLGVPSGVQVEHLATGIIVTCENHRSQHNNRHDAFLDLQSKLNEYLDDDNALLELFSSNLKNIPVHERFKFKTKK